MTAVAPALGLAKPDARLPFAAPARWLDECEFEAVRRRLAGAVPLSLITAQRR